MAFDPALPANSTKLRLAPGVIQNNWAAIEEAQSSFKPEAINLNNRTPLVGVDNDPAAIAETYITYCKDNGVNNPELFGINQGSGITQFTVGVPSRTDDAGVSFLPGPGATVGAFRVAWGNLTMTTSPSATVTPSGFTTRYQFYMTVMGNTVDNFAGEEVGAAGFRFLRDGNTSATVIRWFAIGV